MSYVAVKGGSTAIQAAHRLVRKRMRGDPDAPEITPRQICGQMHLGVDRVMAEASLYDANLAAQAMLQAQGDMIEAIFLLRAYRATLTRFLDSMPLAMDTMRVQRRISAAFKDLPGGQQLGRLMTILTDSSAILIAWRQSPKSSLAKPQSRRSP